MQNVLFFVAHERLPATTYLVLSQSKTLFTAVFAASFLGKHGSEHGGEKHAGEQLRSGACACGRVLENESAFSGVKLRPRQWFSQPLLMVGCARGAGAD